MCAILGGMAEPDQAKDFSTVQAPSEKLVDIASAGTKNVTSIVGATRDLTLNALALPYNFAARPAIHTVTRATRTALNATAGLVWSSGHYAMKRVEDAADWPTKKINAITKGRNGSQYGMAA